MLTSPRRLLSAVLALALGVGFVAAALMLSTSFDASLRAAASGAIRDAAVVLTDDDRSTEAPNINDDYIAALAALPGVERVRASVSTYAVNVTGTSTHTVALLTVPELTDRTTLVAGRLPEAPGEALVNDIAAERREWAPGDTLALDGAGEFTIVGILHAASDTTSDVTRPHVFLQMPDITTAWGRTGYTDLYVHGPGSQAELRDVIVALPQTAATHARVMTAAEASDLRVRQFTRGSEQLGIMLSAFAAVAVIVAGLVVANTFAILVAQRTRQLALLRTVGATRGQVFRTVLREAALLGLVASVAGGLLGAASVGILAPFTRTSEVLHIDGLVVVPRDIIAPLVVGVALAMAAALVPARQATRVAPLAAMRPHVATAVDPRARQGQAVLATVATALGFALLVVGAVALPVLQVSPSLSVTVGIAGGLLSVVGVLSLGRRIVPAVAGRLGAVLRRTGGIPAELAAENAVRNPGRAAATTGALLVGVTLVTMMTVGAATGQASVQRDLDAQFVMDAEVTSWESFTDSQLERVGSLPDVAAATMVRRSGASLPDGSRIALTGFGADASAALRTPGLLAGLGDGILLLGPEAEPTLTDGATITLDGRDDVRLTVRVNPEAGRLAAVTEATLAQLLPDTEPLLWLRFTDEDPLGAPDRIATALSEVGPGVHIMSVADERAQMQGIIDTMLLVVVGLLAVAIIIAIVGIGNTLGLSVHERRQESGLLRAVGLTRAQLRASLAWEAVLLAAVAVVLGLALGIAYGVAGVSSLLASQVAVVPALPWARLGLIAAAALAAGWLASVLPSIRAAKVPPAAALALGE